MLVAEIHGHRVSEAANSEDYLTSAIFGHLRYLSPKVFWDEVFNQALGMPGAAPRSLADELKRRGINLTVYEHLEIRFWSAHPVHGCPDLILVFTGGNGEPFVLLIEAKLWSEKSGTGEFDQIARYLRLLGDPASVDPPLPKQFSSALIYLTEHDCLTELEESVEAFGNSGAARHRIFRLQWQDILDAAQRSLHQATGAEKLILSDVAEFLRRRNLEYFRGFQRIALSQIRVERLEVFTQTLFTRVPLSAAFTPEGLIESRAIF